MNLNRLMWPVLGFALIGLSPLTAQVTAKQGERNPNQFQGSMILDAPFLPANPEHLAKMADWYDSKDYTYLRNYECDRIRIVSFKFRVKKPPKDGKLQVEMRVWLDSPDQNHDKRVDLTLEVHNGETILATAKRSIKVEEGSLVKRDIELSLPASDLKADPTTELRITLRTQDV